MKLSDEITGGRSHSWIRLKPTTQATYISAHQAFRRSS
jgi:hypothetical protein